MNTPEKNQDPDMGWERGERMDANHPDQPNLSADKDAPASDDTAEKREESTFHQAHGNRKYKSYTNHSSADDQPTVNTGPGNM